MYEQAIQLNSIFASLADSTRRDILRRVADVELSVSEIAAPYDLSLAAVSKHLMILEKAKLIIKRRVGKQQIVRADGMALMTAEQYLRSFERLWNERLDALALLLAEEQRNQKEKTHGRDND